MVVCHICGAAESILSSATTVNSSCNLIEALLTIRVLSKDCAESFLANLAILTHSLMFELFNLLNIPSAIRRVILACFCPFSFKLDLSICGSEYFNLNNLDRTTDLRMEIDEQQ